MNLLEYQAKEILKEFGVNIAPSVLIKKPNDLKKIKQGLFKFGYVVKAQVSAGGRGKAGGIKLAANAAKARAAAKAMLGSRLATHQTQGDSLLVESVLVTEKMPLFKELYLSIVLNRQKATPVMLLCGQGGMEIEELAKNNPNAIAEVPLDVWEGAASYRLREAAINVLNVSKEQVPDFTRLAQQLAMAYLQREMLLLEVNPLALTPQGFYAIDAKVILEENALWRQPKSHRFVKENRASLDSAQKKAKELGLSYIPIGGDIGCLVNGAGLAMATMDLIALTGRKPANFLDVGGGANITQTQGAFEILLSNKKLSAIFVNIFGGIVRCDIIAEALVQAAKKHPLNVPLVARLKGTRMNEAKDMLQKAKLAQVQVFEELEDAIAAIGALARTNHVHTS